MNEDVKSENLRIHSRADELIACLEGEIAKRDERIVELDKKYGWALSELAAIKAQGVVMPEREVVTVAYGHDLGGNYTEGYSEGWNDCIDEVERLNAAHVQQVSVPSSAFASRAITHYEAALLAAFPSGSSGEVFNQWNEARRVLNAAPAAPAADAWISVSERLPGDQGHDSEEVLCFLNGHCSLLDNECRQGGGWGIRLGYYDADIGTFRVFGRPESHVTHWMPLPAAPIKIEASRHDH